MQRKYKEKGFLSGIGEKQLSKFKQRAQINYQSKQPQFKPFPPFPKVTHELFFDIEDDPTQEFVYLHGVYERTPTGERFLDQFVATDLTREAEKAAWLDFVDYIHSLPKIDSSSEISIWITFKFLFFRRSLFALAIFLTPAKTKYPSSNKQRTKPKPRPRFAPVTKAVLTR